MLQKILTIHVTRNFSARPILKILSLKHSAVRYRAVVENPITPLAYNKSHNKSNRYMEFGRIAAKLRLDNAVNTALD